MWPDCGEDRGCGVRTGGWPPEGDTVQLPLVVCVALQRSPMVSLQVYMADITSKGDTASMHGGHQSSRETLQVCMVDITVKGHLNDRGLQLQKATI